MRRLLALALLLSLASASTYYVAKTGDDGNPGTEAEPWLTLEHSMTVVAPGDTVWVKRGTYTGVAHTIGIGIWGQPGGTAENPIVFRSYDGWNTILNAFVWVLAPYMRLEGFKVLHDSAANTAALLVGIASGIKVQTPSFGCQIRGCEVVAVPETMFPSSCGIYSGSGMNPGTTIDSCTIHGFGGAEHGHGIYCAGPNTRHTVITHNTCYRNNSNGIQCYPHVESCTVAWNKCYDSYFEHGIVVDGGYNTVHDNICWNNPKGGICLYAGGDTFEHSNYIYNNTSVFNPGPGIEDQQFAGPSVFRNNISAWNSSNYRVKSIDTCDYNVCWPDSNAYYPALASHPYQMWCYDVVGDTWIMRYFAAYQAATGLDAHGILADPLFADTAGRNFHLQAGSPVIDKGDPATPSGVDFDGNTRPQGVAADIGAFETADTTAATVLMRTKLMMGMW